MGLDAYGVVTTEDNWDSKTNTPIDAKKVETFSYWRKHHELHDWMADRWFASAISGTQDEFNCIPFRLDKKTLNDLYEACTSEELYYTIDTGWYVQERQKVDFEFIEQANKFIDEGLVVYYDSWW